jgi:hypothetical protein
MIFSEFQNKLVRGDKFWKLYVTKITEFEFEKFVQCQWHLKDNSSDICSECRGKIKVKRYDDGLCTGAGKERSNVLKIIKKYILEDSLFEI